jgi:hypothetical protein
MFVLSENNEVLDTDVVSEEVCYSVLSFVDYKDPDFYFRKMTVIEEFNSASILLNIGPYSVRMPLYYSILCSDMEYIQSIPLYEINGRDFNVFCLNPIDGYAPRYLPLKASTIYPNTTWTSPSLLDKDLLVVPLGRDTKPRPDGSIERGMDCAIFLPSKMEINRQISDIW